MAGKRLTWCKDELECLGLAVSDGENIRLLAEVLSIWEPEIKTPFNRLLRRYEQWYKCIALEVGFI